jgi:hypothetical protein
VRGDITQCFFLQPTNRKRRSLRRYSVHSSCPDGKYHSRCATLDFVDARHSDTQHPDVPNDHWLWPVACVCGYRFQSDDVIQVFVEDVFARSDNGEITTIIDAPPGAMWFADWLVVEGSNRFRGPDDHCLIVRLPNGNDWVIDGRANNCTLPNDEVHRCWVRTGTIPNITVSKEGGPTCAAGAGSIQCGNYHGFLRNGVFVDA